jgi:protoporphyrinogen oxidase
MTSIPQPKIHIIGGGISGLVAAHKLENFGYQPILLEASDRLGGRVATELVDGFQLDIGFQVLLDAYPRARKHLDYPKLELQAFKSGALIFQNGKAHKIGDPLRELSFLIPTLLAPVGSLADKLKILTLNRKLKKKSLNKIFEEPEQSTLAYLKNFGFSDRFINAFFRPFYAGIFLEPDLKTSSRMFEFVFKMFGQGHATLPKAGIMAISDQLAERLRKTTVKKGVEVQAVHDRVITLKNGEQIESDFTIVATEAGSLIPQMASTANWKSCDTLYFTCPDRVIQEPLIGLNTNPEAFANNIFYHTSLEMEHKGKGELLSVTVVKSHDLPLEDLILEVKKDLEKDFGITESHFLRHYHIVKALPDLDDLKYQREPSESIIMENVAIAGDQLLNGSLNAAMIAGELAAQAAQEVLTGNKF